MTRAFSWPAFGAVSAHSVMRTSLAESCTLSNLITKVFRCVCALFMHRRSLRYVDGSRDLLSNRRLWMMDFQFLWQSVSKLEPFKDVSELFSGIYLDFGWLTCALIVERKWNINIQFVSYERIWIFMTKYYKIQLIKS